MVFGISRQVSKKAPHWVAWL